MKNPNKDPLCGKILRERDPMLASEIDGVLYYFCSPACKKDFDRSMSTLSERMADVGKAPATRY
jgi:YHS domain-containing protein